MGLFRKNKEEIKNNEINNLEDYELNEDELEQVMGNPNFSMMMQYLTQEDLDYINQMTSPIDKEKVAKDLATKRYYEYEQNNKYNEMLRNGKSR